MRGYASELAFAHGLADLAATRTVPAFGGRQDVERKHDGSPVTEIDRATEDLLREAIETAYPGDAVLGEERGRSGPQDAARMWTIDPIDGTKSFADGVPLWTTLIALLVDGAPVLGLADAPVTRDRYTAVRGGGAAKDGAPITVSATAALADAAVGHSGLEEWILGGREDALHRLARSVRRTRGLSDAWGQLQVATGAMDACIEHEPCGVWDWAATQVIVTEAGGRVSDTSGAPCSDGCDLLVTNGLLHEAVLALF